MADDPQEGSHRSDAPPGKIPPSPIRRRNRRGAAGVQGAARRCRRSVGRGPRESRRKGRGKPSFSSHSSQTRPARRSARSPHVDQNTKFYDGQCYQGILYVWDAISDGASTTVVLPDEDPDKHHIPLRELAGGAASVAWQAGAPRLPCPRARWCSGTAASLTQAGEGDSAWRSQRASSRRTGAPEARARKVEFVCWA